jgi:uncharacterized protein (DUF362 family)
MKMDRRDALKYMAAGSVIASAPLGFTQALAATPDLAVFTGDDPAANVRAAVKAMGGIQRFVSKGDKVVIKPNMGFGNPPIRTSTTEPLVVRTLTEMALSAGAKRVLIFDNPCHKADIVLDITGIKSAVSDLDDTFVYMVQKKDLFSEVEIPKGKVLKKQEVARDLLEADTIIAVPVAKSHGGAKVSFGMKGWMGVVRDRRYWHVWVDLHQAIADFATIMRPKLTVIDATRALLTGGPGGPGKVAQLKTIVAGIDPVAVDAYGVTLAEWGGKKLKPSDIPHIVKAAELGVGSMDLSKLNVLKKTV